MSNSLGCCIITKNAGNSISRALNSINGISSQIVVIDTGSIDKTPIICTKFGAEVHFFEWSNDFSKARNYGLDLMRTDWIFVIDSDEVLEIQDLQLDLIDEKTGGINIEIINFMDENNLQLTTSHRYTRIFRNNKLIRYKGSIHEQIRESIEDAGFDIIQGNSKILHYGYSTKTNEKQIRNKEMLDNELLIISSDFNIYHLANTEFSLQNHERAKELFHSIVNSQELSEEQIENIKIRLTQISLITEDIDEITKWTNFVGSNTQVEGFRQFILASSFMIQKKYKEALELFNSHSVNSSSMVDKKLLKNAVEILGEIFEKSLHSHNKK